jgi:protocatechuate 3,4-dioxygenase beta subunit
MYSRRDFLKTLLVVPVASFLSSCAQALGIASPTAAPDTSTPSTLVPTSALGAATLAPTPACGDDDEPTIEQTEGPYFTPNSPLRTSLLEDGMQGVSMLVSGRVLGTDCQPIANALLDFWHADANGVYDNIGYTLRGNQFTDAEGRYQLETIMPGLYPGRTRHFHVKVQRPNGAVLTTQLYFPDEASNATDGIFNPRLLMTMLPPDNGVHGEFNFVLA